MPKRVIDFDAMWGSDKLASCAEWAQAEYAWLYGLADASGCFELTNLRVIWGRVAAIRRNLTIERLEQVFEEFQDKGLLFVWEHEGKRYGHWTGSDVPGRLPPPSWRMRLERLAPPVPKQLFGEYVSRFARGRAALAGGVFREAGDHKSLKDKFESSDLKSHSSGPEFRCADLEFESSNLRFANSDPKSDGSGSLKGGLEGDQAQDWNWSGNGNMKMGGVRSIQRKVESTASHDLVDSTETSCQHREERQLSFPNLNSKSKTLPANGADNSSPASEQSVVSRDPVDAKASAAPGCGENLSARAAGVGLAASANFYPARDKSALVARELNVGCGPSCGPVRVKAEALERIRAREAARRASRAP